MAVNIIPFLSLCAKMSKRMTEHGSVDLFSCLNVRMLYTIWIQFYVILAILSRFLLLLAVIFIHMKMVLQSGAGDLAAIFLCVAFL